MDSRLGLVPAGGSGRVAGLVDDAQASNSYAMSALGNGTGGSTLTAKQAQTRIAELQAQAAVRTREAYGMARFEHSTGRKVRPHTIDEGADFLDSKLGDVDLKGPFVDNSLQPLNMDRMVRSRGKDGVKRRMSRLEEATAAIIHEARDTGSNSIVVDLFGLAQTQAAQLKSQVQAAVTDKTVVFIR